MIDWIIDKVTDEVLAYLIKSFVLRGLPPFLSKVTKPRTKREKYLIWGIGLLVGALLMLVFIFIKLN